jgi:outer membrane protein TolC
MSTRSLPLACLAWLLVLAPAVTTLAAPPVVRIALVSDGPSERLDQTQQILVKEVLDLTRGQFDVRIAEFSAYAGDWTVAGVRRALERALAARDVEIVLATGFVSSAELGRLERFPKPCLGLFVIDAELQGFPLREGRSDVKGFSYLTRPSVVERDLEVFRDLVSFTRLAILYNALIDEVVPELRGRVEERSRAAGVEAVPVPVGSSIDAALAAIPADVQAVYVAPLFNLPSTEWDRLVQGLIERRLPSFSLMGRPEVERGILAGTAPTQDLTRFARRVALLVQRILGGEDPAAFPVSFSVGERLTLNMATARAIGFSPSWSVLTEAELLHQERTAAERKVSLGSSMREAMEANLDLAAEERRVAAGLQDVREARAALRPRLEAASLGTWIDQDRARASFGAQPERSWGASASIQQLVYSDAALANVEIQKSVQSSREAERDQLRLDIGLDASVAYLDMLRAKTFERIQRENLQVIRANLELARVRKAVGAAGPSEVYRWEAEIASGRKEVITANARRNVAEIALNRLLHRPAEEPFLTEEMDLDAPELITSGGRIFGYQDNPADFRILREFLAEVGLASSPELHALDSAIAAQRRALLAARRSFWAPTAAIQADLVQDLAEGGEGKTAPELPFPIEQADDSSFSIGLQLSLPLYDGGARQAEQRRAEQEIARLQLRRMSVAEQVEQRIRAALHIAGASHANIALSRAAAEAARKNLDLVTDAYSRGAISILDLLDAQNAALVADLGAANALYDFVVDLMQVERAVGQFTLLLTPEQREDFYRRLDAHFEKSGRPRPQRQTSGVQP